jgi:hypothetical protein
MRPIVQIDGRRADGTSSPPHLTINDADFIPRVGDFIKFGTSGHEVTKVEIEYAIEAGRPHVIHVTTAG